MERSLGLGLRLLFGLVGVGALVGGVTVGVTELRSLSLGSPPVRTVSAAAFCGLVVWGGASLLRGAFRGRIAVRRPARPARPGRE